MILCAPGWFNLAVEKHESVERSESEELVLEKS
jgi:hypothetical protein